MRDADLRGIQQAGGFAAPIRIIPTAAAPDDNRERAGNNGVRWFRGLGAEDVLSLPLVDRASANDATVAQSLLAARRADRHVERWRHKSWNVYGAGTVTLYRAGRRETHEPGRAFTL